MTTGRRPARYPTFRPITTRRRPVVRPITRVRIEELPAKPSDPDNDAEIVHLVFASGRTAFSQSIEEAVVDLVENPDDPTLVVELLMATPRAFIGEDEDPSEFLEALDGVGANPHAVELAQDCTDYGLQTARLFSRAVKEGNQALILPGLLAIAAQAWPELDGDIRRLQASLED